MQERNEAEYNALMSQATGVTFNFGCRAKQDTYNVSRDSLKYQKQTHRLRRTKLACGTEYQKSVPLITMRKPSISSNFSKVHGRSDFPSQA